MLGLATPAGRRNPNDYLLADEVSVVSYNSHRLALNWASWSLTPRHMQYDSPHLTWYRRDDRLPKGVHPVRFKNAQLPPGYQIGHIVPRGERRSKTSKKKTNRITNLVVQAENSNRGPWKAFEAYLQSLARAGHTVHQIAGVTYEGPTKTVGPGISIPASLWKVAVIIPKGKTLADVSRETRIIAIEIPNDNARVKKTDAWTTFRKNAQVIERKVNKDLAAAHRQEIAGLLRLPDGELGLMTSLSREELAILPAPELNLLSNLRPAVASHLKSKVDQRPIPARQARVAPEGAERSSEQPTAKPATVGR
jgi:endonuclease G